MGSVDQSHVSKSERLPLSVICTNTPDGITTRSQNRLLRPIFINGVEVGFAYSKGSNAMKKLNVRGITITLWYFISRGHQAQALLPFCFKNYREKTNRWDELMALYRMNLVEFTPGFGNDKYIEVNRIMASRAREYGGCMVARSQMHVIVEQNPMLDRTVEQKLLMPSFNGDDLIFPIDGPLGRNGYTFADTLTCTTDNPEWSRCVLQQMSLRDQRIWMTNLANITQNSRWIVTAAKVRHHQHFVSTLPHHSQLEEPQFELHPPETNPYKNRGFSTSRYRTRNGFFVNNRNYYRPSYNNSYMDHFSSPRKSWTPNHGISEANHYFTPSYRQNPRKYDRRMGFIGRPNSIYRLHSLPRTSNSTENSGSVSEQKMVAADNCLADASGCNKVEATCNRNPNHFGAKDDSDRLAEIMEGTGICNRNPNHFGAKDDLEILAEILEGTGQKEEDKGIEKNMSKKQEQKQKKEQEQEQEQNKGEKELLEGTISPEEIKKHSMKEDANAIEREHQNQLVSLSPYEDNSIVFTVINANFPLECELHKLVVRSNSDDAESVVVKTASRNNETDLIYFSDYELENDSLCEAKMLL